MINDFLNGAVNPILEIIDKNQLNLSKLKQEVTIMFEGYDALATNKKANLELQQIQNLIEKIIELAELRKKQKDRK